MNQKFFEIKYIHERKQKNNMKLTIIAKIREACTRFLQPTSSECLQKGLEHINIFTIWYNTRLVRVLKRRLKILTTTYCTIVRFDTLPSLLFASV